MSISDDAALADLSAATDLDFTTCFAADTGSFYQPWFLFTASSEFTFDRVYMYIGGGGEKNTVLARVSAPSSCKPALKSL